MPKYKVAVGRLAVGGQHRVEVGSWLVEVCCVSLTDPDLKPLIEDVVHIPVAQVPTTVARNKLVKLARRQGADILFAVDDDMTPPEGFFKQAFQFLLKHNGPAAVGCPYVTGGRHQKVNVFEFASPGNYDQKSFSLVQIPREDAARRTGIQPCANLGTGCIAYHMGVFDAFERDYRHRRFHDYTYDEDMTSVTETDDCFFHRHLYFAGVPLYCDWDAWGVHHKVTDLGKPWVLERRDIEQTYLDQALSLLRQEQEAE